MISCEKALSVVYNDPLAVNPSRSAEQMLYWQDVVAGMAHGGGDFEK